MVLFYMYVGHIYIQRLKFCTTSLVETIILHIILPFLINDQHHCKYSPSPFHLPHTHTHTGIITYFCPCYTAGKNAEMLGESCIMHGLAYFVPIVDWFCRTKTRGTIREQKGIEGSCFKDCLCVVFCDLCALVQEARVRVIKCCTIAGKT